MKKLFLAVSLLLLAGCNINKETVAQTDTGGAGSVIAAGSKKSDFAVIAAPGDQNHRNGEPVLSADPKKKDFAILRQPPFPGSGVSIQPLNVQTQEAGLLPTTKRLFNLNLIHHG